MSSRSLQIRIICEGPTDFVILRAAIRHALGDNHVITQTYPEISKGFGHVGGFGTGWKGVLGKVRQLGEHGIDGWIAFWANTDLLVVHLDGEVAQESEIDPQWADISAIQVSCPPVELSVDALCDAIRNRLGAVGAEEKIIIAIPMKETENWLLPIYRSEVPFDECQSKPSRHFIGGRPKLLEQSGRKKVEEYRMIESDLVKSWNHVLVQSQALKFHQDLLCILT